MLRWRRRSTVAQRWAQDRLVELVREAALAAHRAGDNDAATAMYDSAQVMRRAIGRKTWRSLATADEAELRAIVERMAERVRQ